MIEENTTEQVKRIPNPTGIGGFQDHPELINPGGRPKNFESFVYWYRVFKNMSIQELKEWQSKNSSKTRTVAADLAFTRIINAKGDLKEFKEVANRSEGMPQQNTDITSGGEKIEIDIGLMLEKVYGENK